jgi:hypothetical protein
MEWLDSLSTGLNSISDLITAATSEDDRALRRLSLRQVLLHQKGWGRARTERVLSDLLSSLGLEPTRRLTVAWLIDARAGGRRVRALADAYPGVQPWIGFPYAPLPAGGGSR